MAQATFKRGDKISIMAIVDDVGDLSNVRLKIGNEYVRITDAHSGVIGVLGLTTPVDWSANPAFQPPVRKP